MAEVGKNAADGGRHVRFEVFVVSEGCLRCLSHEVVRPRFLTGLAERWLAVVLAVVLEE
jgi:hypothetical protein